MHLGALPPAFAGLDPRDADEAASFLQPASFQAGELIMAQGDDDHDLAFIVSGSVSLLDNGTRIGGATARDMLGEVELFGRTPRTATVMASAPTHLQVLALEHWMELCERGSPAVYNIERFSHRRMTERLRYLANGISERTEGSQDAPVGAKTGLMSTLSNLFTPRSANVDRLAVLMASPAFNWAGEELLSQIAGYFGVERLPAGTIVCRQGDVSETAYVIASGQVDLVVKAGRDSAEPVASLGPGLAFGDASLAQHTPGPTTCVCVADTVVLTLSRVHYGELFGADDPAGSVFRQSMLRSLVSHLLAVQERYVAFERAASDTLDAQHRGSPTSTVWRD